MRTHPMNSIFGGLLAAASLLVAPCPSFAAEASDATIAAEREALLKEKAALAEEEKATQPPPTSATLSSTERVARNAANVLREAVSAPEGGISAAILRSAKCVIVFPEVVRVGAIVGMRHGDGIASCRRADGTWSAPGLFAITGASFGLQAGIGAVDLVLLVMNETGMDALMRTSFALGGDAGVAVGPIGRSAEVGTDVLAGAALLSYSRAKGLYAGANVQGSSVRFGKSANAGLYGHEVDMTSLFRGDAPVPSSVAVFANTLAKLGAPQQ